MLSRFAFARQWVCCVYGDQVSLPLRAGSSLYVGGKRFRIAERMREGPSRTGGLETDNRRTPDSWV